jgi:hypothetical protein
MEPRLNYTIWLLKMRKSHEYGPSWNFCQSALEVAAFKGDLGTMGILINMCGADVNAESDGEIESS